MLEVTLTIRTAADDIAAALAYLVHFAEAHDDGALLCRLNAEGVFIPPELVRAAMPAEAA